LSLLVWVYCRVVLYVHSNLGFDEAGKGRMNEVALINMDCFYLPLIQFADEIDRFGFWSHENKQLGGDEATNMLTDRQSRL